MATTVVSDFLSRGETYMHQHHLQDYRRSAWTLCSVHLEFDLLSDHVLVRSHLVVRRQGAGPLLLQGEGLETLSVQVDGQDWPLPASTATTLSVMPLADESHLDILVRIDPEHNTALEGLYRSGPMLCTQCEPEGFRRITWFLDRPDVLAIYTTTLRADRTRYPVLLANGDCVHRAVLADGRHEVRYVDPHPKPSYLFAIVAGDLAMMEDHWVTATGRRVTLQIYAEPADLAACTHAMQSLQAAMAWDERHYGRSYDLDTYMIVAVSHFNMGAMENKGLNIFNTSCVLASPTLTTDAGYDRVAAVIAHEYFHNWTGNRVTCRDWFQLCLKEGLTVYRDQQFSADIGSAAVQRIDDLVHLQTYQWSEDAGPLAHPVRPHTYSEINNFYTATVYEKGAEIVRMLHLTLGDEGFRAGMDLYFSRHDGQAVTVEDFLDALGAANGCDLREFMPWYETVGTPQLRVRWSAASPSMPATLQIEQLHALRPIPLRLAFLDAQGRAVAWQTDAATQGDAIILRQRLTSVTVASSAALPLPVLLRGFSAPVRVDYPYEDGDLWRIIAHESDGVSVWQAWQEIMTRLLVRDLPQMDGALPLVLVQAFQRCLEAAVHDPALVARWLTLPTQAALAERVGSHDPGQLMRLRRRWERQLGLALFAQWQALLPALAHAQAGWRALAGRALAYWSAAAGAARSAHLLELYRQASTMTARQAVFAAVLQMGGVAATWVLQDWRQRFAAHPLVIDMAYAEQVRAAPMDLTGLAGLLARADFDWCNPNRVRSVLMTWALQRQDLLHTATGEGYGLYLTALRRVDALNPQLAARLMAALAVVARMSPALRAQARWYLADAALDGLSNEVQEMRVNILASLGR